jgi:hypothetical protein
MVTTQAFPISMRRVNKKLRLIENPRTNSELIKSSQNKNKQVVISKKVENVVVVNKNVNVKVSKSIDTLTFIVGLVNKAQPWLVLILFISHFLSKRK